MKTLHLLAGAAALTVILSPGRAGAFCGFYVAGADAALYNNATQVVLMRDGTRTVLSMRNNYQGPAEDFAMVVPVPVVLKEEQVKTLPEAIFERVDTLASPRLVEYWEQDPCARISRPSMRRRSRTAKGAAPPTRSREDSDYRVKIEAQFVVGEYDIVILSAEDSVGLYAWLGDNGYKIPDGAEAVLRPYVAGGMKFFVAKVDIQKVKYDRGGRTMLSPLRFHYQSEVFALPVRLGLLNSQGAQDLIVHILARNQRYEVANYKNVFIPTNIRVRPRTRTDFGRFYASLFDETLRRNPGAVVTEYAWQASNCDPCPGPAAALTAAEIATLGADVLVPGAGANLPTATPRGRGRRFTPGLGFNFVLTRLHARYTRNSLGEDLVFKAAPPVVGGREFVVSRGKLEEGARSASINNFQGRYIIRHRWRGPVRCKNPRYGIWGGPPAAIAKRRQNTGLAVARDTALIKKRRTNLRRYVLQSVPEVGIRLRKPKNRTQTKK